MRKKLLSALLAVIITASSLVFTSCGEKSDYPVTLGSVTLKSEPENIVVLTKNLADVISTMGYDVKMVGRSDSVTQKGMQVVPSMGEAHSPSAASIDEAGAEVVFADKTLDLSVKAELEKNGTAVVMLDDANSPKQVKGLYKKLGRVLGGNVTGIKQGADSYSELSSTLKDVRDAAVSDTDSSIVRTIAYLYIDNGVLKTFTGNSWGSTMLGLTGAMNVFKNEKTDVVDNGSLALSNPDFVFCADKNTLSYIKSCDSLKKLGALSSGVFILPLDELTMQGNTALEVLQNMLRDMYPEEFNS